MRRAAGPASRPWSASKPVLVVGAFGALAALMAVVGCGATSSGDDGLTLSEAWIRPTPPVTNVGAFYLTIRNGSSEVDRVVGASSPRCAEIEIHRTDTIDGVTSMRPAEPADLEVAPGAELRFEATGLHVMCLGLDEPVVDGDRIPLTIEFAGAGASTIAAVAENR